MEDIPDIVTYFSEVEDPRVVGRSKHLLIDIIVLTIAAIVAGAEGKSGGMTSRSFQNF